MLSLEKQFTSMASTPTKFYVFISLMSLYSSQAFCILHALKCVNFHFSFLSHFPFQRLLAQTRHSESTWPLCLPYSSHPNRPPRHVSREKHDPKVYMRPSDHCSAFYNSQDMEATHMPINRGMDKEDVGSVCVCIYNGIYYSAIKK